jgi:endonuclease/exonuclease/phosphatase family metal-dependent hydrolase
VGSSSTPLNSCVKKRDQGPRAATTSFAEIREGAPSVRNECTRQEQMPCGDEPSAGIRLASQREGGGRPEGLRMTIERSGFSKRAGFVLGAIALTWVCCTPYVPADGASDELSSAAPEVIASPVDGGDTKDPAAGKAGSAADPAALPAPEACAQVKTTVSEVVKVMTMNVRHDADQWERRFPLIADEIVRLDPDLIGMQEVELRDDQADRLNELIAQRGHARYQVFAKMRSGIVGFFTGEGVAVLSRWPIIDKREQAMEDARVSLRARVKHPSGAEIDVVATHLHHLAGAEADQMRLRQAKVTADLANREAGCRPTFLVGDMNSVDSSEAIAHFASGGFVDSYRAVHGDRTSPAGRTAMITLQEGAFEQAPKRRIDYVFGRSSGPRTVKATDSVVCFKNHDDKGFYPSDHYGVMTTFELRR